MFWLSILDSNCKIKHISLKKFSTFFCHVHTSNSRSFLRFPLIPMLPTFSVISGMNWWVVRGREVMFTWVKTVPSQENIWQMGFVNAEEKVECCGPHIWLVMQNTQNISSPTLQGEVLLRPSILLSLRNALVFFKWLLLNIYMPSINFIINW